MRKKIFVTLLFVLLFSSLIFADGLWYEGLKLKNYEVKGLKNIESSEIFDVINPYIDEAFNKNLYSKIESELCAIEGIDYVSANVVDNISPTGVKLVIEVKELPQISAIDYIGNEKVKSYELTDSLTNIKIGSFFDPSKKGQIEMAIKDLKSVFLSKGFEDTPVELDYKLDSVKNKVSLTFTVQEGIQSRIVAFAYEGNTNVPESSFKKLLTSKTKSLFNNGYLDYSKVETDKYAIMSYYTTLGYIDANIPDIRYEEVSEMSNDKYRAIRVVFEIDEGKQWYYGGLKISGNTIYDSEKLYSLLNMKEGALLNLLNLQSDLSAISDIYYDNGYITCQLNVDENRNEETNTIVYELSIVEGSQSYVEDVRINGLTKTKEYVMTRELELKEGDVFSKAKLVTSAQNLYNTGLLSDLNYNLSYGSQENTVVIDYDVEEGNQMDIQFGATFGGTVTGFPISGFLQWTDHNLGGRGQELSIQTNLSPDSQSASLSFGDSWFRNHRWANTFSFEFSHTKYEDELQKATGNVEYYNGRNGDKTYPKGTTLESWNGGSGDSPSSKDLMDYDLFNVSLGYDSGYTFIYDVGRLSLSGGLSIGLNKAKFDSCYVPFEKLIKLYGDKWQFSNKLSASVTWDGRDYVTNTTKGYVLSTSAVYAGGLLGGLSNYIKLSQSAAAYFKVLTVGEDTDDPKNLMFCASTNASIMLNQFYKNEGKWGWHDPRLGATQYEMLYIDGMTNARGHDPDVDNVFMWDNTLELGYPLVENVLQGEAFISGTALLDDYSSIKKGMDWYFSAGAGIKFKISGFPLGFYFVKNAKIENKSFGWMPGTILHNDKRPNSGIKFVLAISTSLI